MTHRTVGISTDVTEVMDTYSPELVITALFSVLFVVIFIVFMVIFMKKVLPNGNKEDRVESLLESLIKSVEDVDKSITALNNTVNNAKKYTLHDFKYIMPISTENTIHRINRALWTIIDRNSLVKNIDQIEEDIELYVKNAVKKGRDTLELGNFESDLLENFFKSTNKLRDDSILKIQEAFRHTADKLVECEEKKAEILDKDRVTKNKLQYHAEDEEAKGELIMEWELSIEKFKRVVSCEVDAYNELKRNVWQVFEKVLLDTTGSF